MWLYVPVISTSCPSAQGGAVSISESDWRFPALEASVWWRGKPSRSRSWFQRCGKVSFIRLLCGAMPEPSTAAAGVDAWTASLAASRASRTALPGARGEASTSATCGATRGASSSSRDAGSFSSRTSPACSRPGLTKSLEPSGYGETFASWVSRLRADCSRRRRSARATNASACSSSAWPPPAARDFKGANSADHLVNGSGQKHLNQLPNFVEHLWSTARTSDGEKGGPNQSFGAGGIPLPAQAAQWMTPRANENDESAEAFHARRMRMSPGDRMGPNGTLSLQASQWYTPNVPNGGRTLAEDTTPTGMTADGAKRQVGLENQARQWASPRANEGEKAGQWQRAGNFPPVLTLTGQAFSHLTPATSTDGAPSSKERRSLNPLFVEWLMGWPPGWTLILATGLASTGFACSATALSLWKRRMRSALSSLASPPPAPPAHLDLLG